MPGADCTRRHPTSRTSGHRVPDLYDHPRFSAPGLLLLPWSLSLHAMPHLSPAHHETSKHDSPNETKIKEKQNKIVSDLNLNLAKSMTHHNQTKELTTWFLKFWIENWPIFWFSVVTGFASQTNFVNLVVSLHYSRTRAKLLSQTMGYGCFCKANKNSATIVQSKERYNHFSIKILYLSKKYNIVLILFQVLHVSFNVIVLVNYGNRSISGTCSSS
jgi:hypothetical protein